MIIKYARDGESCDREELENQGFRFLEYDFRKKTNVDNNGDFTEVSETVLNFVGFQINDKNDMFSVFPKNFVVKDILKDSNLLFKVISKHFQRRADYYFGNEYGQKYISNYPFAPFFGIYDYYSKFGLHFEDKKFSKSNAGGKANWKDTIRFSNKIIKDSKINLFPIFYEKKYYYSTFLSECIIFSINFTYEKFGFLIDMNKIDMNCSFEYFINEKQNIIINLYSLRQQTFKDNLIVLIDHLINFFNDLNEGGSFYIKHYYFSKIWEDIVKEYLAVNFIEVKDNSLVFGHNKGNNISFIKPIFKPNLANLNHFIMPDYYYENDYFQLIFDAKYYSEIRGIDYKQVAYYFFLNEYHKNLVTKCKRLTYSSLILPGEKRESKLHFMMDPIFNNSNRDFVISEEYLNIRELLYFYTEL